MGYGSGIPKDCIIYIMNVENFYPPKQLGDKLAEMGVEGFRYWHSRELINAMRSDGKYTVIRGNSVRPSEAFAFLEVNRNWKPFAGRKNKKKEAVS